MIGRRSAKTIADAYHERFTSFTRGQYGSREFQYHRDKLYDFLFINNFEGWVLNAIKQIYRSDQRGLLEFLMRFHTGESLASGTPDWSWDKRKTLGQRFLRDLAQALIHARHSDPQFEAYGDQDKKAVDEMQRLLELDGYVYRAGVLLVPEESVLDVEEEEGVLENLIRAVGLPESSTIQHHLQLSEEHYQNENWDDSISNSRKTLEAVLMQVANVYSASSTGKPLPAQTLNRPAAVREYLEQVGVLERKEQTTLGEVYGLLSNTGGHPYIAQQDQARLMRHLSVTFCQFVLLRLQGRLKKKMLGGRP